MVLYTTEDLEGFSGNSGKEDSDKKNKKKNLNIDIFFEGATYKYSYFE